MLALLGFVFIQRERDVVLGQIRRRRLALPIVAVFSWLLAGFFLPAFQLLIRPGSYLAYALTELRSGAAGGFGIWQIDTVPGYIFYLNTLLIGLGGVLLAFGVIGFGRQIWMAWSSRSHAAVLLVLFPLLYYGVMGATRHYFARYALPLVPFLVLFAAEVVNAIVMHVDLRRKKIGWIVLLILVLAASAQPLARSVRFDFLMTQPDTRTIAKEWIEENIPVGSKIAMDWPIHVPPLTADKYEIVLEGDLGLANHSIDYYRQEGFDYLVATSFIYAIPLVDQEMDSDRKSFYSSLDREVELVRMFCPGADASEVPFVFDEIYGPFISLRERERPGPTLKVYYLGN
jgi:hypothetical protein